MLDFGREDRPLRDRARGGADRRLRRRDRRADRRAWAALPARAGRARHRLRHAHPAAAPRAHYMPSVGRIVAAARKACKFAERRIPDAPVHIARSGRGSRRGRNRGLAGQRGRSRRVPISRCVSVETDKAVVEVPFAVERPYRAAVRRKGRSGQGRRRLGRVQREGQEQDTGTVVGEVDSGEKRTRSARDQRGARSARPLQVLPAIRALARKLDVDLNLVQATGPGG